MTMIIDGTNGLTFNNATTQASAGSILQVVQGSYATTVSSASSTYADTGVTASITPKFSTSKVLVLISIGGIGKDSSNTSVNLKLQKNSSDLIAFNVNCIGYTNSTAASFAGSTVFNYLDSPATTSSTAYKVQFASNGNTSNTFVQLNSATSTITLMEIAG